VISIHVTYLERKHKMKSLTTGIVTAITATVLLATTTSAATLTDPTTADIITTTGIFQTTDHCSFSNITDGVTEYDGVSRWIVTKAATIDITAKGQKTIAISPVGTLIEKDTGTVVDPDIRYTYDTSVDAIVAHASNITGVVSTIDHDFITGEIKKTVIVFSAKQTDGSFDTNSTFHADVEIGGYATVDPTKVTELVEYSVQHDVECVQ